MQLLGALVGLVALSEATGGLFGMVFLSIGHLRLFVLLYWHFEGRYFQVAVPWLYMLLAWGVVWLWDRLRGLLHGQVQSPWLAWSVPLLATRGLPLALARQSYRPPHLRHPPHQLHGRHGLAQSQNSTPADVVMTRDPWELNWYTGRKAVMIPFEDLDTIKRSPRNTA